MQFNFVKYKKIFFAISGILTAAVFVSLFVFGLNPGIDFTGGSILEIEYLSQRPSSQEIREKLSGLDLGEISVQPSGERGFIIRMKDVSEDTHQQILQKLGQEAEEKRFESLGPVIGRELRSKTVTLIILSLFFMMVYIVFAFRKATRMVPPWQYGIVSLIVLSHDVLVPMGTFAVLGKLYGVQITIPVVVAILTVVGYAINNVVVVFDRIRENLIRRTSVTFGETINKSINQVFTRCVNTSLTTLLPLVAIFFFGGVTLKYFALALGMGIVAGTYSAVFLAGPLLTIFRRYA